MCWKRGLDCLCGSRRSLTWISRPTAVVRVDPSLLTANAREIIDDPEISIVLELIGGYEPAKTFILDAFRHKKHVVTANKALLLAEHGPEIFRAAHEAGWTSRSKPLLQEAFPYCAPSGRG